MSKKQFGMQFLTAVVALCLFGGVISTPLSAQTGSITGTVRDSSGAVVPKVKIVATEASTGFKRLTMTNQAGLFNLPLLPAGTYQIQATADGFRTFVRSNFAIVTDQHATLDISLELGALTESVNVSGEAPLLNTASSEVSALMDSVRMTQLPLNGRNPIELAALLPGVAGVNAPEYAFGGGVTLNITGSRSSNNQMLFDGATNAELFRNQGDMYPPPDALDQFVVITNNYSAEYGTSGGGVLNAITRSGTNEFHGALWEFLRNDNLNARNFFLPKKTSLIQNQFGLTSGGPVVKNKLFYFFSFEYLKIRPQASSVSAFPPTAAERMGDFSAAKPIKDPSNNGAFFPGNQIPVSQFDSVASAVLSRYLPLANQANGQYISIAPSPINAHQFLAKGDYQPTSRHTFSDRVFFSLTDQVQPLGGSNLPDYSPGEQNFTVKPNNIFSWTYIVSNAMVNQFRSSQFYNVTTVHNMNPDTLASLGGNFPDIAEHPKLPPTLDVSGRFNLQPLYENLNIQHRFETSDDLSWQKNTHALKFGMLWNRSIYRNATYDIAKDGRFRFDGSITGNPLADFLLGKPASMGIISPNYSRHTSGQRFGFYFEDDWRVTSALTLNLGLRYEFATPWKENRGYWSTLYKNSGFQSKRFPGAPVDMAFVGDPGVPDGLINTDLNGFQPRFGFAYKPKRLGQTVFRAGFGVFTEHNNVDIIQNTGQPFQFNDTFYAIEQLSDPLAGLGTLPLEVNVTDPTFKSPFSLFYPNPDYRDGYTYQYNFMVQHEFSGNLSVQVGYVGKTSHKLTSYSEANPAVYVPGASTLGNIQQRRIYRPDLYSTLYESGSDSNARYNSLQVQVIQKFRHGFSLQGAYTYSKALDDYSGAVIGGRAPNPFDRHSAWGPSDFDSKHNANVTFVNAVPNVGHAMFEKILLHDWQISAILTAQTGNPFTVTAGRDIALSGSCCQDANVVGNAVRSHANKDDALREWFNTAAFAFAPEGQYGNAARNDVRGPGMWNLNTGIYRNLPINERFHLQFRSEFFSSFNHMNPGTPGHNFASTTSFGRILSGSGSRVIQFALKLYY